MARVAPFFDSRCILVVTFLRTVKTTDLAYSKSDSVQTHFIRFRYWNLFPTLSVTLFRNSVQFWWKCVEEWRCVKEPGGSEIFAPSETHFDNLYSPYTGSQRRKTRMWANAQRDGRPVKHR